MSFRVEHFPQIPCDAFIVECETLEEAVKFKNVLAAYDLFQFYSSIKPDYANESVVREQDEDGDWWDLDDYEIEERLANV